jgi:predicted ATPase/transcriptional regulator with XRE-family HTH domain
LRVNGSDAFLFGRLLRRHRRNAGLSQQALAERASLSTDAIGMLERGIRRAPYEQTIEALARALALNKRDGEALAAAARDGRSRSRRSLIRFPVPAPLTPLIGRSNDLAAIRPWFAPGGPRLVTITGPGGVGKTRFALEVARVVAESFGGDAAFVSVAALHDPAGIVSAILASLDRKDDGIAASLGAIGAQIGTRRALFVIDNLEQILAGAPTICEFLERCPNAVVIATSREALRVRGEHEFVLQPLDTQSAVELFLQRGRALERGLPNEPNDERLARICNRLDCLPLAIELAAARLRWESVETILEALSSPLSALTFGGRDMPLRQRTIRAAIDWSYELLDEHEQRALCLCSLFVGGGTYDAVAAVASANGSPIGDTGRKLMALADKHLLRLSTSDRQAGRFEMLELIREYARERFDSLEHSNAYERAFAAHWVETIARDPRNNGPTAPSSSIDAIATEYANVCAALRWSAEHDRRLGLRLALLLLAFWQRKGLYAEAKAWLQALVEPIEETIGREEPLEAWRAVTALALSFYWTADSERSCTLGQRALTMARALNDARMTAMSLNNLGIAMLEAGQAHEARNVLQESLALKEGHDDAWSIGSTVGNLGVALRLCGNHDEALKSHRRARRLFRSVGDAWGNVAELNYIGDVHCDRGEYRIAARCYAASLEGNSEAIRTAVAHSFEGLIAIAARHRQFRRAALLAGAVSRIRNETGQPVFPSAAAAMEEACAAARAALGDSAFEDASKAGAEMALFEAMDAALGVETIA